MDNRKLLEKLAKSFDRDELTQFMRASSGKFRPEKSDYNNHPANANFIKDFSGLGRIDFEDGRRLIVLAGKVDKELTSHSGKKKQFEIAQRILGNDFDAGIFVFYDDRGHFRFSLIAIGYKDGKKILTSFRRYTYFVAPELPAYTFINQIGKADFSSIEKITEAFSVEPVTNEFFRSYRRIFEEAETTLKVKWSEEKKRLYTQRFFNRMMFIAFLERKGWLNFNGRKDYLKALFADYHANEENKRTANFHKSRLNTLFFRGLNNPHGDQLSRDPQYKIFQRLIGDVPYLNGGLFEEENDDVDGPVFPDIIVAKMLNDLVYHFNFTVTESTPLDVEVAVDPEMLGRIFEELVTGRHESGSYYTPKPVVAFMCREALKGYLETALPYLTKEVLALFVNENDAAEINNPEAVLNALRAVKVCDPACGSGAYLLGMLHELLEKRESLFTARKVGTKAIYERKLEIIQNNLYGVDVDDFAVNIARLRLWLSLIVDYEDYPPPPLPNLDFKIETGDSLTAPDPSGGLEPDLIRYSKIQEFLRLKNKFQNLHEGQAKKQALHTRIKAIRAEIADGMHTKKVVGFDWAVEFAEVFAPELAQSTLSGRMTGIINTAGGQMELTDAPKEGGFDILLANPPYVRQELLGDYKNLLKPLYPEVYNGTADLFVYFYARAYQLLKNGGMLSFISSNKYFRSGYGEKLRIYLGSKTRISYLIDFGDAPIFKAIAYPSIFIAKKAPASKGQFEALAWRLDSPVDKFDEIRAAETFVMKQSDLHADGWRLENPATLKLIGKLKHTGKPLSEYVDGYLYRGIITGLNEAFVVDKITREHLIGEHSSSARILKPFLRGRDVKRWRIEYAGRYLIKIESSENVKHPWTGKPDKEAEKVFAKTYPAIYEHFVPFRDALIKRLDQGKYFWELRSCSYWNEFEKPKIIYPDIYEHQSFTFTEDGYVSGNTSYFIPTTEKWLCGLFNSKLIEWLYSRISSKLQSGYLRAFSDYMKQIPIAGNPKHRQIEKLTEKILSAKKSNPSADVSTLEREIDLLVYSLYGLTDDEIATVESWA
jgi:type I restriction-modification system DNA methylase subunit